MNNFFISIIIPLYNEEESFYMLIDRLDKLLDTFIVNIEIVLVDDGSTDCTTSMMAIKALSDDRYQTIFLSKNYGQQLAITAGLAKARGKEGVFVIDGDLQDPPELLQDFYLKYKEGFEVVYAIRKNRKENIFIRISYYLFYRILSKISNINMLLDSGDFSFISRKLVDILNTMPEESRYLRGMRTWVGFKQIGIEYERKERVAGKSKYSLMKLVKLAKDGVFNFSEFPIRFITRLGFVITTLALLYFFYTLIQKIFYNNVPKGFTGLLITIILFSGVQLLSLGVIGEYIIRIFFQVKKRPLFIIKDIIINKEVCQ